MSTPPGPDQPDEAARSRCYEDYMNAALAGVFEEPESFLARHGVVDDGLHEVLSRVYELGQRQRKREKG